MFSITSPRRHQVLQRDSSNQAFVEVGGTCDTSTDRVEVRFVPFQDRPGPSTAWHVITPWFDAWAARVPVPAG